MPADKATPKSDWWHEPGNRERGIKALWSSTTINWKAVVHGKPRRDKILALMKEGMQVIVNRSHWIPLNKDLDLLRLLKQGKIVRTKLQHCTVNYTVLVYNYELDSDC